jgi:hypothetical protein
MENLIIFNQNLIIQGPARNKQTCSCYSHFAEAENNKKRFDDRQKTEPIATVVLPLTIFGGKHGFNDALAVLRNIDGVTGANLFFRETAVRIHYVPNLTNINIIFTIIKTMGLGLNDDPSFQDMPVKGVVNI